MSNLFSFSYSLKNIDLSNFNTKNVTNMNNMFNQCNGLEKINLSNFNTAKLLIFVYVWSMHSIKRN